jgi:putative ABC transport system permease protein
VALIGVPVAIAVFMAGIVRTSELTREEQLELTFGDAEYRISSSGYSAEADAWVGQTMADIDPEAHLLLYHDAYGRFGKGQYGRLTDIDVSDPLGDSVFTIIDGRAPEADDEIALSPTFAAAIEARVGDSVDLALLVDDESVYHVVGLVTQPMVINEVAALVTPDRLLELSGRDVVADGNITSQWLVTSPMGESSAVELSERWVDDQQAFWPDSAVVPVPAELQGLAPEIYVQLDQDQVDSLVARDFSDGGEFGSPEEALYQAAYEMVAEDGYENFMIPSLYVDLPSAYGSDYVDAFSSPPAVATGLAALMLAEVAFVAGAAFAAGTRRRLREIGLLGANGANVKQIRLTVLGEGLTVGFLGGLLGIAAAVLVMIVARPVVQRFVYYRIDGVELLPWDVIGPLAVAVVATMIAAWLPARTASKVPTTTALQGRMPAKAPRPWVAPVGIGLAAFGGLLLLVALGGSGGAASNVVAVLGSLLMVGGVALLAGPIVELVSRLANRLRSTPRLVLRDSGRHRTRASVAVAATMVILIAPMLTLTLQATEDQRSLLYGLPEPDDLVVLAGSYDEVGQLAPVTEADIAAVAGLVPEDSVARYTRLNVATILEGEATPPDADNHNGGNFDDLGEPILGTPEWGAALASPELVSTLGEPAIATAVGEDGVVILGVRDRESWVMIDGEQHDAREIPVPLMWGLPRVLVSEQFAETLGDVEQLDGAVFHLSRPMTTEERNELFYGNLEIYGGWSDISSTEIFLIAMGVTLLAVLIVVSLVTAVAAAEIKEEMEVIVAVGAPGSIRRKFLGIQTWLYSTIAAVLAVPLGVGAVKIFGLAQGGHYGGPFGTLESSYTVVPWLGIGFVVVVIPAVVALLTGLATRSAPVTPPRRAS